MIGVQNVVLLHGAGLRGLRCRGEIVIELSKADSHHRIQWGG